MGDTIRSAPDYQCFFYRGIVSARPFLLELSDVMPNAIHLTVARLRRNLPRLPGVRIHTTQRPFDPRDVVDLHGIRVTSTLRTILDSAEAGTQPDQVEMAIWQALESGLLTRRRLLENVQSRSGRVERLVRGALKSLPGDCLEAPIRG